MSPRTINHIDSHSTQTTLFLIILVTVAATIITTPSAHAQIPLGTVVVGDPIACPSGFYTGMTCLGLTVICPSTDNLSVTIGYVGPTVLSTPTGTIVFFGGGSGTTPTNPAQTSCRSKMTTSRITRS